MISVETHVVTLSVGYGDSGEVHEVFRGSETECRQLATRITGCSNDRHAICSAMIVYGPIEDWEAHVIPILHQSELMMYGKDVMERTSPGLRSM